MQACDLRQRADGWKLQEKTTRLSWVSSRKARGPNAWEVREDWKWKLPEPFQGRSHSRDSWAAAFVGNDYPRGGRSSSCGCPSGKRWFANWKSDGEQKLVRRGICRSGRTKLTTPWLQWWWSWGIWESSSGTSSSGEVSLSSSDSWWWLQEEQSCLGIEECSPGWLHICVDALIEETKRLQSRKMVVANFKLGGCETFL